MQQTTPGEQFNGPVKVNLVFARAACQQLFRGGGPGNGKVVVHTEQNVKGSLQGLLWFAARAGQPVMIAVLNGIGKYSSEQDKGPA